jgi:hypothetical protein
MHLVAEASTGQEAVIARTPRPSRYDAAYSSCINAGLLRIPNPNKGRNSRPKWAEEICLRRAPWQDWVSIFRSTCEEPMSYHPSLFAPYAMRRVLALRSASMITNLHESTEVGVGGGS